MKIVKRSPAWGIMMVLLIVATSCSSPAGKKQGDTDVYLGGKVIEKGEQIIIEGKSNLLEGARVHGEVLVDDEEQFSDTTELTDKKGNFEMELDHPEYGEAEVVVTFNLENSQEEEIVDHYGENGSKLEGPFTYIIKNRGSEGLKQEARIELSVDEDDEETKHEFAVPEWKERPDDYGDGRVWMELSDVTDDGEYFYISGESNMVEGSELIADHYSSASTHVLPDGTFHFKLDYHYDEEDPIVIKFKPRNQWGNVQKQYGEDGKKLVGNLVVQQNNYLMLEYPYEYEE